MSHQVIAGPEGQVECLVCITIPAQQKQNCPICASQEDLIKIAIISTDSAYGAALVTVDSAHRVRIVVAHLLSAAYVAGSAPCRRDEGVWASGHRRQSRTLGAPWS